MIELLMVIILSSIPILYAATGELVVEKSGILKDRPSKAGIPCRSSLPVRAEVDRFRAVELTGETCCRPHLHFLTRSNPLFSNPALSPRLLNWRMPFLSRKNTMSHVKPGNSSFAVSLACRGCLPNR